MRSRERYAVATAAPRPYAGFTSAWTTVDGVPRNSVYTVAAALAAAIEAFLDRVLRPPGPGTGTGSG